MLFTESQTGETCCGLEYNVVWRGYLQAMNIVVTVSRILVNEEYTRKGRHGNHILSMSAVWPTEGRRYLAR